MARGTDRERQVRRLLEADDWWVGRVAGSLGDADLVALKQGRRPRLIEVKSTAGGPYEHFGPNDRSDLAFAAELAGADAWLCWWPPRDRPRWIPSSAWPSGLHAVPVVRIESPAFACIVDESGGLMTETTPTPEPTPEPTEPTEPTPDDDDGSGGETLVDPGAPTGVPEVEDDADLVG